MHADPSQSRVEALIQRINRLESIQQIRRLQHAYGYFIDKALYAGALDCFSHDGEIYFLNGIFRGRAGLERLYDAFLRRNPAGIKPPIRGLLIDHPMMQDIVHISNDGQSAEARFRILELTGVHESNNAASGEVAIPQPLEMVGVHVLKSDGMPPPPVIPLNAPPSRQWIGGSIFENSYMREGNSWKIRRLHYHVSWNVDFREGWAHGESRMTNFDQLFPIDLNGPDAFCSPIANWPRHGLLHFHYTHPVTEKRLSSE